MIDKSKILNFVKEVLKEDIGPADITTNALISRELKIKGVILAKEEGVICGIEVAELIFNILDPRIRFLPTIKDGAKIEKTQEVIYLEGPARGILAGERTALNFLAHLSGISTLTNQFVKKVANYKTKIYDTRKTTPNLRYLEKYAVRVGGGFNHRFGLYDQLLIKENHISAFSVQRFDKLTISRNVPSAVEGRPASSKENIIPALVNTARRKVQKNVKVEIEVQNLEEFKQAINSKPDIIMLDNMKLEEIKEAVSLRDKSGVKVFIEVSGGLNLENVEKVASTGVDMISIGALTHSAKCLDFSLEVINRG
jgi:nicotinate-nucleotide pyrophosphorylase (carboxylating)